jgi:hypothetical protein
VAAIESAVTAPPTADSSRPKIAWTTVPESCWKTIARASALKWPRACPRPVVDRPRNLDEMIEDLVPGAKLLDRCGE